jgi:pimeloyl-ACP methyl ester carboxylesterase
MILENPYSGREGGAKMKPTPFEIAIPQERLDDLRRRLQTTRWPGDFGNEHWRYGVERGWLEGMVDYWAGDFDWRAQEAAMNRFDHYKVAIDGVPIHFIHMRGKGPNPVPLILTHGWPWTFWDWKDVIGPLVDPAAHGGDPRDSFDVIVPSLPGFGFSEPLGTTGIGVREVAKLWVKLMRDVLGYAKFAAAGGDWGALITSELGHAHSDALHGIYLTLPFMVGMDLWNIPRDAFAPNEQWMYERMMEARPTIESHVSVHLRDPQTLAYALADSPVGTAAWIWERRRAWSDCNGDVAKHFGRDFLCTTASLYWLTNTIGSSFRIYTEHFSREWAPLHDRRPLVPVPTGFGISPKEVVMVPRKWLEERSDLQRYTLFPRGGHFAPSEAPEQVIPEYREFFRRFR